MKIYRRTHKHHDKLKTYESHASACCNQNHCHNTQTRIQCNCLEAWPCFFPWRWLFSIIILAWTNRTHDLPRTTWISQQVDNYNWQTLHTPHTHHIKFFISVIFLMVSQVTLLQKQNNDCKKWYCKNLSSLIYCSPFPPYYRSGRSRIILLYSGPLYFLQRPKTAP